MTPLISVLFFLALAVSTYQSAKRQGRWSWLQFLVVVVALIVVPILIVWPLMHASWAQDRPALATFVAVGLIMLFVTAIAIALKKIWPLGPKPKS